MSRIGCSAAYSQVVPAAVIAATMRHFVHWRRLLLMTMLRVALVEPEIPQNTGNIARLCAATNTPLHIVGATGFRLDDRAVRRAGLDYWPEVKLQRHLDLPALYAQLPAARFLYLSTKAERAYTDWQFETNDCLVFGRETRGLPEDL